MSSSNSRPPPRRTARPARIAAMSVALIAVGSGLAGCGASQPGSEVAEQPRLTEDRRAWSEPPPAPSTTLRSPPADPYASAGAPRALPVDGPAAYEPSSARAPAWPSAHREIVPPDASPLPPLAEPPPAARSPYMPARPTATAPPPAASHAAVPPGWIATPPPPSPYGAMPPHAADGHAPAGGPAAAPAPVAAAVGSTVVVEPGETAYRIATRHGVSVQSLMQANNLAGPSIKAGQTLVIPGR